MSVTIENIMNLPALKGAKIVAGKNGLSRIILSVTVLECNNLDLLRNECMSNPRCYGSEIVITGFIAFRNNVEAQCKSIRKLAEDGESALIIYYVGCIIPYLDKRVIDTANELDITLIVMPENKIELRYSDAIDEIMEVIIRDRLNDNYFVSEVMEMISRLSSNRRNVNAVLDMIRDRIHCSLFIVDSFLRVLNESEWPRDRGLPVDIILAQFGKQFANDYSLETLEIEGNRYWGTHTLVDEDNGVRLYLCIVKETEDLGMDLCKQATEVLQTYFRLWTENHGTIEAKQLIKSILQDETPAMKRIASILRIEISAFSEMMIVSLAEDDSKTISFKKIENAKSIIEGFLKNYVKPNKYICDIYERDLIIFTEALSNEAKDLLPELRQELQSDGTGIDMTIFETLTNAKKAKETYKKYQVYKSYATAIYPKKYFLTSADINIAKYCKEIYDSGGDELAERKEMLCSMYQNEKDKELLDTLAVYLLDAEGNASKTADYIFVHKNTVKYRIKVIEKIIGHEIGKMPESYELYIASALVRIEKYLNP